MRVRALRVMRVQLDIRDQRPVIAGLARQLALTPRELEKVHAAAHEDRIERTHRAPRGERERPALDATKKDSVILYRSKPAGSPLCVGC